MHKNSYKEDKIQIDQQNQLEKVLDAFENIFIKKRYNYHYIKKKRVFVYKIKHTNFHHRRPQVGF